MDIQKIKKRLYEQYGDQVKLAENQSYTKMIDPLIFIDSEYGEWKTSPNNVLNKKCTHPKRKLEKRKRTTVSLYGVDNVFKSKKIKEKIKSKLLEKYGADHPMRSQRIKQKAQQTCWERYGAKSPLENQEVLEKIKNSLLQSCGVEYGDVKKCISKTVHILPNGLTLSEYVTKHGKFKHYTSCLKTYKKYGFLLLQEYVEGDKTFETTSTLEEQTKTLLNLTKNNTTVGKRKPDFVLNTCIFLDVDGLYWHSTAQKNKQYHFIKRIEYENINCRLLQIRANEIETKHQIVKSIIQHVLGKSIQISAKKCKIKPVFYMEAQNFLEKNHLEGCGVAKSFIGLYHYEQLVLIIGYEKNGCEVKIDRLCSLIGHQIIGGISKIIQYLEHLLQPTLFYGWCNLRYATGAGLESCGFEAIEDVLTWQLTDYSNVYSPTTTCQNRKLVKIYDAGQRLYIKKADYKKRLVYN